VINFALWVKSLFNQLLQRFLLNFDTQSAAQIGKKVAYNTYCMQLFYGGIQVQKREKYRLKIGIKPYAYCASGKV
jgi:hypothetical protein